MGQSDNDNKKPYDLPDAGAVMAHKRYNFAMEKFKFHFPIEVRLGDLDAFWHVNNTKFLVYLEHARSLYMQEMGFFDKVNLWNLPLIVGDVHCRYHNPILFGDKVIVSMGTTRITEKTVTYEYEITGENGLGFHVTGTVTLSLPAGG